MTSQQYSTAENAPGSLAQRVQFQRLEGSRGPLAAMAGIAFAAAILIAVGEAFGVLISNTDSAAPAGVYRVVGHDINRGDLVAACLPIAIAQVGLARGYLRTGGCAGDGEPVDKIVGALPGDLVEIEPGWLAINGKRIAHSVTAAHDSAGRPLTHVAWGKRQVAANEIWLFGFNDRRSWDSRYFGPIPIANVRGKLEPVLTW
ncbi:MAG TPA: conjugative transfer signal peptidase TraF [Candidatus Binataceae bacterium]|nr:conjugative transfer signal peptidase TraF [Candidatus Binataceae bacterium]